MQVKPSYDALARALYELGDATGLFSDGPKMLLGYGMDMADAAEVYRVFHAAMQHVTNPPEGTDRAIPLRLGAKLIPDIRNASAEDIDLDALEGNLRAVRRFSGASLALTIKEHALFVTSLAARHGASTEVVQWALHHDDHEAIIGDMPGPLKAQLRQHTSLLDDIERSLDSAIAKARGIPDPTPLVRSDVHYYDKLAETLEWQHVLGHSPAGWNMTIPDWLDDDSIWGLLVDARMAVKK